MKKWRMIWGAVILAGMLGGCQRNYSADDPFQLYDCGFGKPEAEVVELFSLDSNGWIRTPSDTRREPITYEYFKQKNLPEGGNLSVSLQCSEAFGLYRIDLRLINQPTDKNGFYEDAQHLYRLCEERFGEPGIASESDLEYCQKMAEYYAQAGSMVLLGEGRKREWLDWSAFTSAGDFYAHMDAVSDRFRLYNQYYNTEEGSDISTVYVEARCTDPEAEEMTADFTVSIQRDMTDWEEMERRRADAE